jgi:hypothetical protein
MGVSDHEGSKPSCLWLDMMMARMGLYGTRLKHALVRLGSSLEPCPRTAHRQIQGCFGPAGRDYFCQEAGPTACKLTRMSLASPYKRSSRVSTIL